MDKQDLHGIINEQYRIISDLQKRVTKCESDDWQIKTERERYKRALGFAECVMEKSRSILISMQHKNILYEWKSENRIADEIIREIEEVSECIKMMKDISK